MPFYPSLGVGGHCIPVDPWYLSYKADQVKKPTELLNKALIINDRMYHYVANKVIKALGGSLASKKILIVGISYKKDIDDERGSPSLKLIQSLKPFAFKVDYFDPLIPKASNGMESASLEHIEDYDCVVLCVAHSVIDIIYLASKAKCLIDVTNNRWLEHYSSNYIAA